MINKIKRFVEGSKRLKYGFLFLILLLPYLGLYAVYQHYEYQSQGIRNASFVLISKQDMQLRLINYKGDEILKVPVAIGLNVGNKQKEGDKKTPEGVFSVSEIQESSSWEHDFKDGKGRIKGAYGNYFIRLNTPGHKGIGIHGTHLPKSLGTRATEGCIRLHNNDLVNIMSKIQVGTVVVIIPGKEDVKIQEKAVPLSL